MNIQSTRINMVKQQLRTGDVLNSSILDLYTEIPREEFVLEVGTGTGFLTALLSRLCKKVISIDYYASFTASATRKLAEHLCTNVDLHTGDACRGWLESAPYDVMVFTGSIESLNDTHRLQLVPGGKLFAIVGNEPVMQGQLHTLDHDGIWHAELIFETNIPPLIDKLKPKDFVF